MGLTFWFYALLTSIFLFCLFCYAKDQVGGGSDKFSDVMFRLIARHVKLALILVGGSILAFFGVMAILKMNETPPVTGGTGGGFQTEKLAGFVNRVTLPIQWIVNGFINFLGLAALALISGVKLFIQSYQRTPQLFNICLIILYLLWLGFTIRELVMDELSTKNSLECTTWSVAAAGAWVLLVLGTVTLVTSVDWSFLVTQN